MNEGETTVQVEQKELDQLRMKASHLERLEVKEKEVRKLKEDWDKKKDASLAAKKKFDEADAELRDAIAEHVDGQIRMPFASNFEDKPKEPLGKNEVEPIVEGWESIPITACSMQKGIVKLLKENGIKTMGAFEARRRDHGRALDIDGIGPDKADKANDAVDEWLRQNRDKVVFDGAAAADSGNGKLVEEPRYFKLNVDVRAGETTHANGGVFLVAEELGDGRIALWTTPGSEVIFTVDPTEGSFVAAKQASTRIRITKPVPGTDESMGLGVGSEVEVVGWHGENAMVKCSNDAEVMVTKAEFELVDAAIVEISA